MTTEDKQILLQDLCARLPYGVVIKEEYGDYINVNIYNAHIEHLIDRILAGVDKLVLCPMSSMTAEEYNEYQELYDYEERSYNQGCEFYDEWKVEINNAERLFKITDWLNAHHFDYRELIEKGLALPAPEGMY